MKQIILISVLLISIFACTKQQQPIIVNNTPIVVSNKLLDKDWIMYKYKLNGVMYPSNTTGINVHIRNYGSNGNVIDDKGLTSEKTIAYTTTNYITFKYALGALVNDTIIMQSDTNVVFHSSDTGVSGFNYTSYYKLK